LTKHNSDFITETVIYLNDTNTNWNWVHKEDPDPFFNEVDIEFVGLHELGHVLGIAHSNNSNDIMFSEGFEGRTLQNNDRYAFANLYLLDDIATGLEDGLGIVSDDKNIVENQTCQYEAYFYDYEPLGDAIQSWDSFIINLGHKEGNYELANSSAAGQPIGGIQPDYFGWEIDIPTLPQGYEWNFDQNGYVNGSVVISGTDNDGVFHHTDYLIGINIAPITPKNFEGETENGHPKLVWDANPEADVEEYEIWKKINSGSYSLTASTSNTYYVDSDENVIGQPEANDKDIYYKVRAVDLSGKKSNYTSSLHYLVEGEPLWSSSQGDNSKDIIVTEYELDTNTPNPFNPTTQISYALPEASAVTLEVFDVSGRKVSVLVKKSQEQGWHYATFVGGTLPSGIYIYRISATGMESGKRFTQAKRMLLVK